MSNDVDAIVVGSGPNGLAAAIKLAQEGWSVRVYEAKSTPGGGMRTYDDLTISGYRHDICSAIHPLGMASPYMRTLPLADYGLEWIQPDIPVAHPLDDGTAAALYQSFEQTGETIGRDAEAYKKLMQPLAENWEAIANFILGPLRFPRDPISVTQFGLRAILPTTLLTRIFRDDHAKALFAGLSAHSFLRMEQPPSAAIGLVLGALGHVVGWPLPKGGSQSIADAMVAYLRDLGGEVICDAPVLHIDDLPKAKAYLFDTTPKQLLDIAGSRIPDGAYKTQLKIFRYGPGVFKVDWALSEPIPWAAPEVRKAGTVHLGGTLREIAASERAIWQAKPVDQPYVLLAQQSVFDDTRTPDDKHVAWAYCHVPRFSIEDMTEQIEAQVERFAPGFRDTILARHTMNSDDYQQYNMNYIGGDINGGIADLFQLFTRPAIRLRPYTTPAKGIYLCSSSTPPGGGVHGMCGYHAAGAVLHDFR